MKKTVRNENQSRGVPSRSVPVRSGSARSRGHQQLDEPQLGAVAELFGVLSEVSRLRILQLLQTGAKSVGELVEGTGFKQANVSKQLGILLAAGVIDRRQDGNRAFYSIKLPLVFDLCGLVCAGVAKQAAQRAAELAPQPERRQGING